jgi:hypothetical protein
MLDWFIGECMVLIHYVTNDMKEPTQLILILEYKSNNGTWWVSQDERIFVYSTNYLGKYHTNNILLLG